MPDFKDDPPPTFRTVEFGALADKANENVPDPEVYQFSNGRKFYDQQNPYQWAEDIQ